MRISDGDAPAGHVVELDRLVEESGLLGDLQLDVHLLLGEVVTK